MVNPLFTITKEGINGIELGSSVEAGNLANVKKSGLILEFQSKLVASISFRNASEFSLNGEIIQSSNFDMFFEGKDTYYDGDVYTIPSENLCIQCELDHPQNYELTLYGDALKSLYEKDLLPSNLFRPKMASTDFSIKDEVRVEPFTTIGNLKFGMDENEIYAILGSPVSQSLGVKGKTIYSYEGFQLRFDDCQLSQVTFELAGSNLFRNKQIIYDSIILNSPKGIEELIQKQKLVERKGYVVFPDIGIAIDRTSAFPDQIFCFAPILAKFWVNTNRPITSW